MLVNGGYKNHLNKTLSMAITNTEVTLNCWKITELETQVLNQQNLAYTKVLTRERNQVD